MPPAAWIFWICFQMASPSWPVRVSTYQEPPAGSTGLSRLNSSCIMTWMFRAMRREKGSLSRTAASKGRIFMPLTPPTTPEKAWVVARSTFT